MWGKKYGAEARDPPLGAELFFGGVRCDEKQNLYRAGGQLERDCLG
jgi:hypothetical protein